jgi:probable blue pigment (indigoidine) exporter
LIALVPMALWGGVFVAVKSGERSGVPGLEMAAGRALPAGLVLGAVALFRIRHAFVARRDYARLAGMAVSIAAMYGIAFVVARRLPVAIDALLANASPLFAVGLAAVFLRERVNLAQIAGVVLGACGVLVMAVPSLHTAPGDFWAMMEMLAAALMLAINTIFMKKASAVDPVLANAVQFVAAGLLLLAASAVAGERLVWTARPEALAAVAYVSLAATALAYVLWMRAVTLLTVARASVLLFLVPVFGLVWGWLFLRETMTAAQAAGSLLVVVGVSLASLGSGGRSTSLGASASPPA